MQIAHCASSPPSTWMSAYGVYFLAIPHLLLLQFIYTVATLLPTKLMYDYYPVNIAFLLCWLLAACWQGSVYYIEVRGGYKIACAIATFARTVAVDVCSRVMYTVVCACRAAMYFSKSVPYFSFPPHPLLHFLILPLTPVPPLTHAPDSAGVLRALPRVFRARHRHIRRAQGGGAAAARWKRGGRPISC